jgi:hypothetical protein
MALLLGVVKSVAVFFVVGSTFVLVLLDAYEPQPVTMEFEALLDDAIPRLLVLLEPESLVEDFQVAFAEALGDEARLARAYDFQPGGILLAQ